MSSQSATRVVSDQTPTGRIRDGDLRAENTFLRSVLASMLNAVLTLDERGVIRSVNHATALLLGYGEQELVGRPIAFVIPARHLGPDGSAAGDVLAALLHADEEQIWTSKEGRAIPVQLSTSVVLGEAGEILGAACVVVDLTQRKMLEANLRHAQKMEAVGTLAAGVAHEINTPIQYVTDTVQYLRDAVATTREVLELYRGQARELALACGRPELLNEWEQHEVAADLDYMLEEIPTSFDRALEGAGRIATIVRAMKDFAHPGHREMALADVNRALSGTLVVARNEYKYVAEVSADLGDVPPVLCHVGDLGQVFLNLLVNASHAIADMVKDSGQLGRISIRTWFIPAGAEGDVGGAGGRGSVAIEISDSGAGIPDSIAHRVYDPFFTTKDVGKGTGQGLAIARSVIVDRHHGRIGFTSRQGKGTTFLITLPVAPPTTNKESEPREG